MSQIEHLVTLQNPNNGLSQSKARIVYRDPDAYVCNGTRFVYVFSTEKKQITAAYVFPTNVWQIEVSPGPHQLYALCAQDGLYLLQWDGHGRLLMEPNSATNKGDMTIYHIGSNFGLLVDPSLCSFTVTSKFLVVAVTQLEKWTIRVFPRESPNLKVPSGAIEFPHRCDASRGDRQPVLCCVSLWKEEAMRAEAPCHLALDAALFTRLFGVDVSLLDSPIVLCGFPDGQVVSFPLTSTGVHPSQLLYHLEQPVVSIGAVRMDPEPSAENRACDCLQVVGQKGLIVSVTGGDSPDAVSCAYKDHTLLAPVSCAFFSRSGVFCCTASDVLYVTASHPEKKVTASATSCTVSSLRHNIPMIAALSHVSSSDDTRLIALSKKGRLMLCKVNRKETQDVQRGLCGASAGQRIKELLSGIGSVSERLSTLKTVAHEKSRSLAKLNQVMSVTRALLSGQSATSPVRCVIRVSWTHLLQKANVTACCRLENQSDYTLQHGWTLSVLVSTDPATAYSFPVLLLKPGETKEFAFPLCGEKPSSVDFPITVSCSLFYRFSAERATSSSHKHGVCVPLQEHVIDVLQCLRLGPPADYCSALSHTLLEDAVQHIWKSAFVSDKKWTTPAAVSNQPLKASVRLSAALLTRALQTENPGRPLCSAALRWLLSELKEDDVTEVQGVTPDGNDFCIRVQEVSVSDLTSEGPIPAVEVQILSSCLHVVASLHLAVISRVQVLLQQDKPGDGSQAAGDGSQAAGDGSQAPGLSLGKIQQLFSDHKLFVKEVTTLRDRLGAEEDLVSRAATQRLLHVYGDLRDPGLLFI